MNNTLIELAAVISIGIIIRLLRQWNSKPTHLLTKTQNNSIEDFKNRTIHKVLTVEMIDNTPNEKLLQIVFDNIVAKNSKDFHDEFEKITALSKERQAIYIIWLLETEVNNGGFDQYYFNSSGRFADLAPEALSLVGAKKFANLVERANALHKKEYTIQSIRPDGTLESFLESKTDNLLNSFDDEFYALAESENLEDLQINFIRKNKLKLIDSI